MPPRGLIRLKMQPNFPMEDLTDDNKEFIDYTLRHESGFEPYYRDLEKSQRYVHYIADQALRESGITTRYDEDEYSAFTQGFATFDVINILVHPPRPYDAGLAVASIRRLFAKADKMLDDEVFGILHDSEGITKNYLSGKDLDEPAETTAVTRILDATNTSSELGTTFADVALQDSILLQRSLLANFYPNTYGVIVGLNTDRDYTLAELQLCVAGASLARALQTTN